MSGYLLVKQMNDLLYRLEFRVIMASSPEMLMFWNDFEPKDDYTTH